jgi:sec-independent protein translocase protein TatA
MGLSGISPMSLILILLLCFFLFGTQRLKSLGTDLGEFIKNFRKGMNDASKPETKDP